MKNTKTYPAKSEQKHDKYQPVKNTREPQPVCSEEITVKDSSGIVSELVRFSTLVDTLSDSITCLNEKLESIQTHYPCEEGPEKGMLSDGGSSAIANHLKELNFRFEKHIIRIRNLKDAIDL
jgi:hypothetical protein